MKTVQPATHGRGTGRRIAGRAQDDHILDPYQLRHKPQEPAACPQCGAVYHRGRWQWAPRPDEAHEATCPACRRIADAMPAGVVTVYGGSGPQRQAEMTGLARNEEAAEKQEHPLNRIVGIEPGADGGFSISTTDIHLPRRIGEALQRAYHGMLEIHFDEGGYFVRVDWHPPAQSSNHRDHRA